METEADDGEDGGGDLLNVFPQKHCRLGSQLRLQDTDEVLLCAISILQSPKNGIPKDPNAHGVQRHADAKLQHGGDLHVGRGGEEQRGRNDATQRLSDPHDEPRSDIHTPRRPSRSPYHDQRSGEHIPEKSLREGQELTKC